MEDREEAEYRQRAVVYVRGRAALTVFSCGEIDESVVRYCAAVAEEQLAGCPDAILKQLAWRNAEIALVGRGYKSRRQLKLTDVPALQHFVLPLQPLQSALGIPHLPGEGSLKGVCFAPRTGPPVAAVLVEANLLPDTLVHELGHMVMEAGLIGLGIWRWLEISSKITDTFAAAEADALYGKDAYIMTTEKEYFACSTQSYFDAGWDQHTLRARWTSTPSVRFAHGDLGVTTRTALEARDPRGAALMEQVWGDGEWRPRHTPRPMRWYQPFWPREDESPLPAPPPRSALQRLEDLPRPVVEVGTLVGLGAAYKMLKIGKRLIR